MPDKEREKFEARKEAVAVGMAALSFYLSEAARKVSSAKDEEEVLKVLKGVEDELERSFGVLNTQLEAIDGGDTEPEYKLP